MRAALMYHSIDRSSSPISVDPETFRRHVRWLASGAVRVVPLAQLMSDGSGDAVALTFDDGFANFESEAAPLLAEHGLPATLFVVTGHVGRANDWGGRGQRHVPTLPLLGWDSLGKLAGSGIEIGAHTRTHRPLDELSDDEIEDELGSSSREIEARTGRRPSTFAYPYGRTSPVAVAAARGHFAISCTTELRACGASEDPARLPRLDAYYLRAPGRLERWGSGELARYLWVRAHARRVRRTFAR
ncbi:MAG TPA: polysaccharide deacetylase family protein [Gemmatimonadaceae bacterium]|nr:polysaccharide deacetylase family protein [Gemmatimonadaceae bacterium]